MYLLRLLVVIFLLLFTQAAWIPTLQIAGVGPDLLFGLLFLVSLRRGVHWSVWTAVFLGLLLDVEQPDRLGLDSLAYGLGGLIVVWGSKQIDKANPLVLVVLLFLSALAVETVRAFWLSHGEVGALLALWLRWALPAAIYTTLFWPLLAWAAARVLGRREWILGAP